MADSSNSGTGEDLSEDATGYSSAAMSDLSGVGRAVVSLLWGARVAVTSPLAVVVSLLSGALVVYGTQWFPNSVVLGGVVEMAVEVLAATVLVAVGRAEFFPEANDLRSVVRNATDRVSYVAGLVVVVTLFVFALVLLSVIVSWLVTELSLPVLVLGLAFLGVRTLLAVPAIVVDEVDTLDGIALGWVGSRGNLLAVLVLLGFGLVDTAVRVFALPAGTTVTTAANVVLSAAVVAVFALGTTRFYVEIREEYAAGTD